MILDTILSILLGSTFTLRVIGDVQVGNTQEVEYAARTLFAELMTPTEDGETVNLFLGDQTNTDLTLAPIVSQMIAALPDTSYTVVGNHDRDLTGPQTPQDSTYRANFGAPYYSFDRGNVHFMVLNNVEPRGRKGYRGRIADEQLEWLRSDVERQPEGRQYVVAMHIPATLTANADSLYHIFEQRGVKQLLVLAGHVHQVMRGVTVRPSGLTVQEVAAGAACGAWWTGERDQFGVPSALMHGGSPRGYFVFDFDAEGSYRFRYKGIGLDPHQQMTVWVAGVDSTDQHVDSLRMRPVGEVYATVYGATDSTVVRCQLDGGAWVTGEHVEASDANVARIRQLNTDKAYPTAWNRMNPIRRRPSPQVWRFRFDPATVQGQHQLRLEATDRFGFSATAFRPFFLR